MQTKLCDMVYITKNAVLSDFNRKEVYLMAKANNSPTNWATELTTGDKTNLLGVFDEFRKLPALHKTDAPEIADRGYG